MWNSYKSKINYENLLRDVIYNSFIVELWHKHTIVIVEKT